MFCLFFFSGIKYLGSNLTLDIRIPQTTLTVTSVDDNWPLIMDNGKYNVTLVPGMIGKFIIMVRGKEVLQSTRMCCQLIIAESDIVL